MTEFELQYSILDYYLLTAVINNNFFQVGINLNIYPSFYIYYKVYCYFVWQTEISNTIEVTDI